MKIVLYSNGLKNLGKKLEDMILLRVAGAQVENYLSIEKIVQILRQPLNCVSVVVLLVASEDQLIKFNSMNPFFDNIKVILILSDRQKETLELGHKLKTSFISYIDSDLQDVVSVLEQIEKKSK